MVCEAVEEIPGVEGDGDGDTSGASGEVGGESEKIPGVEGDGDGDTSGASGEVGGNQRKFLELKEMETGTLPEPRVR
jgi:hypothetical protein